MNVGRILIFDPVASFREVGHSLYDFAGQAPLENEIEHRVSGLVLESLLVCQVLNYAIPLGYMMQTGSQDLRLPASENCKCRTVHHGMLTR